MEHTVKNVISKILNHNKNGCKKGSGYYNRNKKWLSGTFLKDELELVLQETNRDPQKLHQLLEREPGFQEAILQQTNKLAKSYMMGIIGSEKKLIQTEHRLIQKVKKQKTKQEKKKQLQAERAEQRRKNKIYNAQQRLKEQQKKKKQKAAERALIKELGLSPNKLKLAKLLFIKHTK